MKEERIDEREMYERELAELEIEEETVEEERIYKYSREETIAAISDYYTFLTQMYMDESHVVYPPPGGWPEIVNADPAALESLGKSDEVIALLAHLPYIRGDWDDAAQITPGSSVADWPDLITLLSEPLPPGDGMTRAEEVRLYTEGTFCRISPPHVVGLIRNRDQAMVLDTKHGVIHWEDCPGKVRHGEHCKVSVDWSELDPDETVSQEEADWRYDATAWTVSDFFEVLKDQFIHLHWLPISSCSLRTFVDVDYPGEEGMMAMLRETYREHGWPDVPIYPKSDCLEAVKKAMSERYPDSVCYRTRD
jgi:hypothetical protein